MNRYKYYHSVVCRLLMIPASQADYLAIGHGLGASGGKPQANSGLQADWVANGVG